MKRIGYIYEKICSIENIKQAILKSSLGKRGKRFVKHVLESIDTCSVEIQKMLIDKSYIPSPYTIKIIQDESSNKE